ncbi:MAG: outer membrane beta-barrel protein [Gemmatimonadota bacterium]|nr:MAG: outer membrane beta-barrel protein [Gemmatimonadota bacterium]
MSMRSLLLAALSLAFFTPTQQAVGQTQGLVVEANFGYHRFGEMGNGLGIDAALMHAWPSGVQLGLRGEYFLPNTVEEFRGVTEWSEVGVFVEVRYRFFPSRRSGPYVALLPGVQWYTNDTEYEDPGGPTYRFGGTERDRSLGVVAGLELALSDGLWLTFSVLGSRGDAPEYGKNRVALRLGAKYGFASN